MLSPRDNLISLISDLYKDLHGFRPRGLYNWGGMDIDDLGEEADYLGHLLVSTWKPIAWRRIELDRIWREDIALGVVAPTPDVKLEPWEVWEARAEFAGFGA
jgi:hypothetical protein